MIRLITGLAASALFLLAAAAACFAELPRDLVSVPPYTSGLPVEIKDWKAKPGSAFGAEKPEYNDSAWENVNPGFKWQGMNSIYWFRAKLKLPAEADGKPVFFYTSADDGGTVFIDGERRDSFRGSTRLLMLNKAKAGQTVTIAILAENNDGTGAFTAAGYKIVPSPALITLETAAARLKEIGPVNYVDIVGWKFSDKNIKNAADTALDDSDWSPVTLSHRGEGGKASYWYRTSFTVPAEIRGLPFPDGAIELEFDANDTADVYINGKRVKSVKGSGAVDATGRLKPGDTIQLAVKVTALLGDGRFRSARLHAKGFDELQKRIGGVNNAFESARLFLEQVPQPPKEALDGLATAAAAIEAAAKAKNPAELETALGAAAAGFKPMEKLIADLPVFIKGPYLQNVRKDGVTVMWETLAPADSTVWYGKGALQMKAHDPAPKTIHEIVISGLDEETKYKYVAVSNKLAAPQGEFRTAIRRDTPFSFAVWGDNRTDPVSHEMVIDSMIKFKPDIALNVGDVVTTGINYGEWGREYFIPIRRLGLTTPTYIAIGNHEYGGYGCGNPVEWFDKFVSHPAPNDYYFAFTFGNSRFIALNPQEEAACYDVAPGTEQYKWLIDEFESEEYRKAAFRFVFLHEPPYSECWSGGYYDGESRLRANLVPLAEKYDVDIVFAGHTHDYERGQWPKPDGPYYIITGGGGSALDDTKYKEWEQIDVYKFVYHFVNVSINGNRLEFKAVGTDGGIFDSFEIVK